MNDGDIHNVLVELGDRSYELLIGPGILGRTSSYEGLRGGSEALIVTNTTVGPLYAPVLRRALSPLFRHIGQVELPDGEAFKDWVTLNRVFDALLETQCDRK